ARPCRRRPRGRPCRRCPAPVIVMAGPHGTSCMKLPLACLAFALSGVLTCAAQVPMPGDDGMDAEQAARLQAAQDAVGSWYTRAAEQLAASGKARDLAFAATLLEGARPAAPAASAPDGDAPSQAVRRDARVGQWRQLASARAGS